VPEGKLVARRTPEPGYWLSLFKSSTYEVGLNEQTGCKAGDTFSRDLFETLLKEEYEKLLKADTRDVFDSSKTTTLPISKEIVTTYIHSNEKLPWFIDLLNINLNNFDLAVAKTRIDKYVRAFTEDGTRITGNLEAVDA
jgi:malate synthase